MTAIEVEEIARGLVVFLDKGILNSHPRVTSTGTLSRDDEPRPCVCYRVEENESVWTPLTTERRGERLEIEEVWKSGGNPDCSGGYPQWLEQTQYLQDGANTYRGPHEVFVKASWRECTAMGSRACVSEDGMARINAEIEVQRHRRGKLEVENGGLTDEPPRPDQAGAGSDAPPATDSSTGAQAVAEVMSSIGAVQAHIRLLLDKGFGDDGLSRFEAGALEALSGDLEDFRDLVGRVEVGPELMRYEAERLRRHAETYRKNDDRPETGDLIGYMDTFLNGVAVLLKGYEVVQGGG